MSKLFILIFTITFLSLFCNCKDVKEGNHGLELLQGLRGLQGLKGLQGLRGQQGQRGLMAPHLVKQKNPRARV